MKTRSFSRKERVIQVEHPDGGLFHLRTASVADASAMIEDLARTDFVYSKAGEMVYNKNSGEPVRETKFDLGSMVRQAQRFVKKITNIRDEDRDEMIELVAGKADEIGNHDDLIRQILEQPGEIEVEVEVERDGEKVTETKKVSKPVYEWVLEKVQSAVRQRAEVIEKN